MVADELSLTLVELDRNSLHFAVRFVSDLAYDLSPNQLMRHDRSHSIFQRAKQLMPGGVNSPARAFGAVGGEPIVIERGEGAYLFDVDGNRYIDYIGSWGPMILGHGHPRVREAIHRAVDQGLSFGAPTPGENELAELIVGAVPSMEKVRLVNSGTEATMSAIRLARGFTGRDVIVKFAGNYHGHVDSLLVAAGSRRDDTGGPEFSGRHRGHQPGHADSAVQRCAGTEDGVCDSRFAHRGCHH